ncbi:DUF6580 family putative transport protein [Terrimonas pollutisoli]|uniref:DUF6580 family putative transport protein n=1 Tax=Terrimonas pollutisoli TaxID=3034147 RepID=UPI0023EDCBC8|nr:DUF6580 family putative transport protein [Terrimonas sp. H1YJ31]
MKINARLIVFTLLLIVLAAVCKYFFGPNLDWSGFSPVIAIALFSGFIVRQKNASFLLPLLALFISDVVIQFLYMQDLFPYAGFYGDQWKNYLILLSATLIGWLLKGKNYSNLLVGAIAAPTVFFLISNFNVWLSAEVTYSRDFSGLMTCYAAGLPFYKNALIATLLFLPGILLLYNYLTRKKAILTVA